MAITWADVQAIAPELTDTAVPTATQAIFIEMVDRQIDEDIWLDFANDGRRYLAAHLGTIYATTSSAGGAILSETLGPMSRTYSDASSTDGNGLENTKYGVWYLQLIRLLPSALGFVP